MDKRLKKILKEARTAEDAAVEEMRKDSEQKIGDTIRKIAFSLAQQKNKMQFFIGHLDIETIHQLRSVNIQGTRKETGRAAIGRALHDTYAQLADDHIKKIDRCQRIILDTIEDLWDTDIDITQLEFDGKSQAVRLLTDSMNGGTLDEREITSRIIRGKGDTIQEIIPLAIKRQTQAERRLLQTQDTYMISKALERATNAKAYYFMTMADENVCQICRALDGRRFLYEEEMVGVNFPPIHPNCRCIAVPEDIRT